MIATDKNSKKLQDSEFTDERILSIAACQGNFLVDKHSPSNMLRNTAAKNLVTLGYMKNHGTEGRTRYYAITESGKAYLKEIQAA